MGLGFLIPAFLAGLGALLVPIMLHLRHRERDKPLRFPSLMFLRRIPIRTAQRRRITDWLLLALRAGVLALLVAAFARPFVGPAVVARQAVPARTVVVLLDRSLSMGHRAVWPAALDSARAVVNGLGPEDRVAVVLFDDDAEVAQPLSTDRALALAAIDAARPSSRGTRYPAALRAARQVLGGVQGTRAEAVVVTDVQRSGLAGLAGLELPADLEVRVVAVGPERRPDAALVGADLERVQDGDRSRLLASARLLVRDQPRGVKAVVALTVDGRPSGTREVTLPENGALTVAFEAVPLQAGPARVAITLPGDDLAGNDTLRATVAAEDLLRVLLVAAADAPAEETLFLERALAIGRAPRIEVTRRAAASLDARALAAARLVLFLDVPVAPNALLGDWVRAGGGVVTAAGRRLAARPAPAPLVPGGIRGMADRLDDKGGAFGEVFLDHPIFTPFKDGAAALASARFLRYPRATADSGAQVLARFDDGSPAVIERDFGRGRTLLLTAPLDAQSGDFPLQPAYLPFLRRLTLFAAGYDPAPLWRTTGDSRRVSERIKEPVVATPGGALNRLPADSAARAIVLREAGFYDIYEGRASGTPLETLAANPPAAESDLTPADPRELLLGVRRSDSTLAAREAPPTPAEREGSQRLWRLLLLAAAVLFALEMLVANRGWRATASQVLPTAPERSAS